MSPRRDGGPDRSPQLTLVSGIFGVAGVLALVVALVVGQAAVAVFGVIALVIGAGAYGAQRVRERSANEAEQTLGAGPLMSPMERHEPRPTPPDPMDTPPPSASSDDWIEEGYEEPEPTISEEDDGTGARPGNRAAANVGAATATDLNADARTGRDTTEGTEATQSVETRPDDSDDADDTDDGDDDEPRDAADRVDLTVRRHGGTDKDRRGEDDEDDEAAEHTEPSERGAQARSGDGAG